jgi:hypothetical protein
MTKWCKAYINNVEIPLDDCLLENGMLSTPDYMQEGDTFKLVSAPVFVGSRQRIQPLSYTSETIH